MPSVPHLIMGTAGHVDHGKTSLVKRLTGVDLDTLPEEKSRGMTINLGFTYFDTPSGMRIGVVDVPGHRRFVHTMLAGAHGIDFVLFLVACDDSVMPQTKEHLQILRLFGIQYGIVVLTKIDLVDAELRLMVLEEINEILRHTFLEQAPRIGISNVTGEGIGELIEAIDDLAQKIPPRETGGGFRLFVDRVFIVAGAGTVVTGTALSGAVSPGDELELLPGRGLVRVRQIQSHGKSVDRAVAGQRAALNIRFVDKEQVQAGDLLATPGLVRPTYMIDARLESLRDLPQPLHHWQRVRLYSGTTEAFARLVLLDSELLLPADSAYVQLRLEAEMPVSNHDRFIIRDVSGERTLGGGTVLDAHPVKHKRQRQQMVGDLAVREKGYLSEVLELEARKAGYFVEVHKTAADLNVSEEQLRDAAQELIKRGTLKALGQPAAHGFMHLFAWSRAGERLSRYLSEHHRALPQLEKGLPEGELRQRLIRETGADFPAERFAEMMSGMAAEGRFREVDKTWILAGHQASLSDVDQEKIGALLKQYQDHPFAPPATDDAVAESGLPREVARGRLDAWQKQSKLVRVSKDFLFDADAVGKAERILLDYLEQHETITVSEFRELIGSSRKYALPLMLYFDQKGLTQREGEARKRGPRKG